MLPRLLPRVARPGECCGEVVLTDGVVVAAEVSVVLVEPVCGSAEVAALEPVPITVAIRDVAVELGRAARSPALSLRPRPRLAAEPALPITVAMREPAAGPERSGERSPLLAKLRSEDCVLLRIVDLPEDRRVLERPLNTLGCERNTFGCDRGALGARRMEPLRLLLLTVPEPALADGREERAELLWDLELPRLAEREAGRPAGRALLRAAGLEEARALLRPRDERFEALDFFADTGSAANIRTTAIAAKTASIILK